MGMTRVAALVALTGFALIVTGLTVLFGAWALVAAGLTLVAAGLLADWEKVT